MFSPATGYAAIALGHLATCQSRSTTVEAIARATDIPAAYLSKIMHTLARKGFVRTRRGVGGGAELTCDPVRTTLLELCQALDDPIINQRCCMLGVAPCSDERDCPAHEFWTKHRQQLVDFAGKITIQSLAEFEQIQRISPTKPKRAGATSSRRLPSGSPKKSRKRGGQ